MANLTRANWATDLAITWTQPEIGLTFLSDAPLFHALGPGIPNAGFFNQNWSSGSLWDNVGAALTGPNATASSIDINNIIQMGALIGLEQVSTIVQGNGFSRDQEAMNARNLALQGGYTKFMAGLIGTDTGKANGTIQGMKNIITSYGLGAGQQLAGGAANTTLAKLDAARAACTALGTPYVLTSPKGESLLKSQMRGSSTQAQYLTDENFGTGSILVYDGMPVFVTDQLAATTVTDFFVFKVGPSAMQLLLPITGPFEVGDPIAVAKQAFIQRNLTLQCQIAYWSPRSCARIVNQTL